MQEELIQTSADLQNVLQILSPDKVFDKFVNDFQIVLLKDLSKVKQFLNQSSWVFDVIIDEYNQPKLKDQNKLMVRTSQGLKFLNISDIQIKTLNIQSLIKLQVYVIGIVTEDPHTIIGFQINHDLDKFWLGCLNRGLDRNYGFHIESNLDLEIIDQKIKLNNLSLVVQRNIERYFVDGHNIFHAIFEREPTQESQSHQESWLRKARKRSREFRLKKQTGDMLTEFNFTKDKTTMNRYILEIQSNGEFDWKCNTWPILHQEFDTDDELKARKFEKLRSKVLRIAGVNRVESQMSAQLKLNGF